MPNQHKHFHSNSIIIEPPLIYFCCSAAVFYVGTLSKSLGQIIRVSAGMHILFHLDQEGPLPQTISDEAIDAAIDFVEVCCQHIAFITGHGQIDKELEVIGSGEKQKQNCSYYYNSCHTGTAATTSAVEKTNEALVLCLPGEKLDVSHIVNKQKKFRDRGGRDGALAAMQQLEKDGLGELILKKSRGSVKVCFHIMPMPLQSS